MKIKTVAIVGGTHGNEYTGPYLLKLLEGSEVIDKYSSLDIN